MYTKEKILAAVRHISLPESLEKIASLFPGTVVFSSSFGQEDQVITDSICRNKISIKIITLDTGRLFNETYELIEKTTARYKIPVHIYFPEAGDVEEFVTGKGINCFYESAENRKQCCFIRKVKPLNRALHGARVWITGLRSDQSENRNSMEMLGWDENRRLYKFNPLIHWTTDEVLEYIQKNNVPYNPLHDRRFASIGCAPCTRAVEPGEDPRAGRWWWEASHKECGLHTEQKNKLNSKAK